MILGRVSGSYAHGSESSSPLLRETGRCFAFHSGGQFCHVAEGQVNGSKAAVRVAEEICKASRITTEGTLNIT